MSFAAWSATFTTLIGAISEQSLLQSLLQIKAKMKYLHKNEFLIKLYTKSSL